MTIPFYLITPEKILFQHEVESATMPTVDGEITVLPHHIPLVTALTYGVIKLRYGGEEHFVSVADGVVKVDATGVTVLATGAERADELIAEQVEKALYDAKKLAEEKRGSDNEFAQAMLLVQRETARLHAVKRHRMKTGTFGGVS
jgi:F-type H+-transporting ATPase subunit epsilon